ncbi:carbohydrate ABC transporter permease [Kribbella solani]|uniref:ABC-type glycerol-3-phosphate transport system permease component n=1 Tax=Kribbella solani TaxID=236067 RepID=A0A841DXA9_9ACTN|nr:carbohydrate ABC transporter permease [Kribbella solani]MBB5980857.1 ABC-type glycerol-3-phosphate transport system permease component [Kribbella solani]MDX2968558.1 carbohydrate ABC transporter permease [Kribbella solani]MDX3003424.1 carbohydrate ABC transporter permease [Kribbella solani]
MTTKRRLGKLGLYGGMLVALVVFVGPFLYAVLSSLKQPSELNGVEKNFLPGTLYTENYTNLFRTSNFPVYLVNSLVVAVVTTTLSLLIAILAGYALARFKFAGNRLLLLSVVNMQMFPAVLMAVPLYKILRELDMLNSRTGLTIVYVTLALPFCIWMMRNYFLTVPIEVEEAALIDGCNMFTALWRVALPPALPGAAAAGAFCVVNVWDEFLYANTFIDSDENRTLSVGLNSLIGQYTTDWGQLLAGGVVMTIPVVIIFAFLQRYLTQIAGGGVKG